MDFQWHALSWHHNQETTESNDGKLAEGRRLCRFCYTCREIQFTGQRHEFKEELPFFQAFWRLVDFLSTTVLGAISSSCNIAESLTIFEKDHGL
jgi:hypothetical protein